jgi:hypothetical protein
MHCTSPPAERRGRFRALAAPGAPLTHARIAAGGMVEPPRPSLYRPTGVPVDSFVETRACALKTRAQEAPTPLASGSPEPKVRSATGTSAGIGRLEPAWRAKPHPRARKRKHRPPGPYVLPRLLREVSWERGWSREHVANASDGAVFTADHEEPLQRTGRAEYRRRRCHALVEVPLTVLSLTVTQKSPPTTCPSLRWPSQLKMLRSIA